MLAPVLLGGCDSSNDLLGLHPEPAKEIVAPLKLTGRVVDAANVIPPDKEAELVQQLEVIQAETRAQLVVVTIPTLDGYSIADYGLALGRGWGIGDKDRNDGVILLLAPNDRKTRIEVGYGLEDILTFERSGQIVDEMLVHFKDGAYVRGIEVGVDKIGADLRMEAETKIAA
ncbi:hypothetical protein GRI35_12225 [Altererythrobacter aestiaquae]|uniref:TPM domain-containing protein n=1 Tax=Pontixanthobacter aestiaquae TaxID=1509367 RepID=A0A844Z9F3_9SPHN|nr:hypothetical protein [Pontixanthobacter aestiaquae]